jgi:hypothetical protein
LYDTSVQSKLVLKSEDKHPCKTGGAPKRVQ